MHYQDLETRLKRIEKRLDMFDKLIDMLFKRTKDKP